MRKALTLLVAGATLILTLTGCGTAIAELPDGAVNESDSIAVLETLDTAEVIEVNKSLISFGDGWSVKADGEDVAELKGQYIKVFGDTYSMYTPEGTLVASEAEEVAQAADDDK